MLLTVLVLTVWTSVGTVAVGQVSDRAQATADLTGVGTGSVDPSAVSPLPSLAGFIDVYMQDRRALERLYDISISPQRADRLKRLYREKLISLEAIDFNALDAQARIDWVLLKNHLEFEIRELTHAERKAAEIDDLLPFSGAIISLEENRRLLHRQEPRASADVVSAIPGLISDAKATIEKQLADGSAADPVLGRRAAMAVDELRGALRDWNRYYAEYSPSFTWWLKEPYASADKALSDYAWFLREKLAGFRKGEDEPVIGDPIGREALVEYLRAEMIPYSPEELIAIAEKEFEWAEREMKRAADDLGFDGNWKKTLDHVSTLSVEPGEQPALIKLLADEAVMFLEDRDLVTIPDLAKETWRMEMMSPERQKVNPYFTGGEVISVSYPTADMTHADKLMGMRGNNIHFSRATVQHELIPGHHLQLYMGRRYNTYRGPFRTPFLVEGWALYWEMRLWDLGFPQSAEDRVGMLFWRSHRSARIVFSLRYHLGQMTAQEAIDYLVDRVGHERRNAIAEVRRSVAGDYSPTYQAAYMLGGLQFRALHRELVQSGKMSERDFHDAILRENAIPVEMIRASLSGRMIDKDFKTTWRFYD